MNTSFKKVHRFIERHSMLDGAAGVLVAVSGGPDSVVLLDVLAGLTSGYGGWGLGVGGEERASEREHQQGKDRVGREHVQQAKLLPALAQTQTPFPNPRIHVGHLDHMLRGRESAKDAEFVRALADRLGLPVAINSIDVRAAAEASSRGIEEIAREIRYDFLLSVANETGCDRIAVGHTMTDQAETFLMRLIRGAGLRGLAAMRPVIPAHSFCEAREEEERGMQKAKNANLPSAICLLPSVLIIRPLLCITREEVEAYCRERGLEFRTDITNQSMHYTRNRIRNEVLPALRAINPRVVGSIARAAENIAGDQDVLDGLASSLLEKARLASDGWRHVVDGGTAAYSVIALLEQPAGMRRRMIIEAIRHARTSATREERGNSGEATSTHVSAVEALLRPKSSGKHATLPGCLQVWREFDSLVFKPAAPAPETLVYECEIDAEHPQAEAGGFTFTLLRGQPGESLKSVIEATQLEKRRIGRDWMIVALDDHALPERLVIRPRLRGERAHAVGQRRTIKLKNLMIDHRIPSRGRATWPLVTTPDGGYIWSPGLPPASKFAAHDETQCIAIMRASTI